MPWNRVLAAVGVAGLAALAGRYAAGLARADRSWPGQVQARLSGLGEVDEVSILPLVERLTSGGSDLAGEPGGVLPHPCGRHAGAVRLRAVRRQGGIGARTQRADARRAAG